jgi:hypothetical protein
MDLISDFISLESKENVINIEDYLCFRVKGFYINRGNCHLYPIDCKYPTSIDKKRLSELKVGKISFYAFKIGTFKIKRGFISFGSQCLQFDEKYYGNIFQITKFFNDIIINPISTVNWNVDMLLNILDKFPTRGFPFITKVYLHSYFSFLPFLLQSCKEEKIENIYRRSSNIYDTILYMYCHIYDIKIKKYLNCPYKKEIDILPKNKKEIISFCLGKEEFYYCQYGIKKTKDKLNPVKNLLKKL